ncbi:MAG: saccharopine dehydrogenase family protein, partial [Cytophagales bacterium]|nr:saccharopine dehydrogenase family protein [Cytophagales bacterium]
MSKVIIIGAGGVGRVTTYKCAENSIVFKEIVLASRTKSKCDLIAEDVKNDLRVKIKTDQVDADYVDQVVALFRKHNPVLVINVALPYQDLTIMDACLECGVHYLDTAN